MSVRRPHQAAYWQVTLAAAPELLAQRRQWCRGNVAPLPLRVAWLGPGLPSAFVRPGRLDHEEIWHFARHEDAALFDMAWS